RVITGAIAWDPSDDVRCSRTRRNVYSIRSYYPHDGAPTEIGIDVGKHQIAFARIDPDGANLRVHDVSYISSPVGRTIGGWAVGTEMFYAEHAEVLSAGTR